MNMLIKSFFIGVFGDLILQLITYQKSLKGGDFAGLKKYFTQHGIMESAMIGGGIMFICTWLYLQIVNYLKAPVTVLNLFVYGAILDVIWRKFNLMPSLKNTYYKALNPYISAIWGGIPMTMILIGDKNIKLY